MARAYYRILLILSGDLNSGVLGPFTNRSQDDCTFLNQYTQIPDPAGNVPRAVLVQGDGFAQSEAATAGLAPPVGPLHGNILTNTLGADFVAGAYGVLSGNSAQYSTLTTFGPIAGDVYGVGNSCLWGNDVLAADVVATSTAQKSSEYQQVGVNHYVSGVYAAPTASGPHQYHYSYLDGWDIRHLFSRPPAPVNGIGRLGYFYKVFGSLASAVCQVNGTPAITLDSPQNGNGGQWVDFMSLRNNPLVSGQATVHFGLAKNDHVTVKVYDVTGRVVRTLADRNFQAGEHDLIWDGSDDSGVQMARGVYFTQVKYSNSKFADAKKISVLK
jgi:hypothetical protein